MQIATNAETPSSAEHFNKPVQFKLAYSKSEFAELMSVSLRTVDYLIESGELVTRRVGRRVLIPCGSISQFMRRDHKTGRKKSRFV